MPRCPDDDECTYHEWLIYDAVLMELSAPHLDMTVLEEADFKGRLLAVIEATAHERESGVLMRLFRDAMCKVPR